MDFARTEPQQDLADLARRILTDHVTQDRLRELEAGPRRFDPVLWSALADAGVLGAGLPESVGGGGFGVLEQCSVLIECGRAVAPIPYLASISVAASAVAAFGTDEQRAAWAEPATRGLVLTAALAESPDDDPLEPTTRADFIDGQWRLTGSKTAVPAGELAELILVPARTSDGLTVFAVRPDDPGVTRQPQHLVDGDQSALLVLHDVACAPDRILGEPGEGAAVVRFLVDRGTLGLCATQLGVTERALELTAEYARTRRQFDRAIGSFQAVAHRLADAYLDVEAIRLTLWQAACLIADGQPAVPELATAKFWAADGGHRVAHTAVHVHGGVGIDVDHALHRYFVAAKRNEFELGGATAQLRRFGAHLANQP